MVGLGITVGVLVLLIGWIVGMYNGLVKLRNRFKNAFAQIDVQLKRRHDLIPNLVETAKAFLAHERGTLEAVIQARNAAASARTAAAANPDNPTTMQTLMKAEAGLSGMLGKLFALSEAYPELKSDKTMMQLSEELTTTENKVAFSRQAYNDAVMNYNNKREMFPSSVVAGMFNFAEGTLFETETEAERQPVKVQF